MRYIRTKQGRIYDVKKYSWLDIDDDGNYHLWHKPQFSCLYHVDIEEEDIVKTSDTIEELCDCFVKIKRKGNCKPYILKFDYKDLPTLKEQAIKYKDSPVYGAIHIEDKGLFYVAKMNESGVLELL